MNQRHPLLCILSLPDVPYLSFQLVPKVHALPVQGLCRSLEFRVICTAQKVQCWVDAYLAEIICQAMAEPMARVFPADKRDAGMGISLST